MTACGNLSLHSLTISSEIALPLRMRFKTAFLGSTKLFLASVGTVCCPHGSIESPCVLSGRCEDEIPRALSHSRALLTFHLATTHPMRLPNFGSVQQGSSRLSGNSQRNIEPSCRCLLWMDWGTAKSQMCWAFLRGRCGRAFMAPENVSQSNSIHTCDALGL